MTPLAFDNLARAGAATIVDSLVLGFLVAAIAWAVLVLLRKHRAAIRFLILAAALATVGILPALRTFLGAHPVSASAPMFHLGESVALVIAVVWALGAAIGLLRVGIGILNLGRIRRRCERVTLPPELSEIVEKFCPSRRVQVLVGNAVSVPSAIGFFRPSVILPPWLLDELSPAEVRQVLIHELSHLRRRDDWTNLLQRIVKALFFFHPAVWWLESRLSLEREMACDDAVLAQSDNARDYAECLAHLAEKSLLRRGLAMAQAAVSRMRQTTRRLSRILQIDRAARGGKFAVSFATVFAITGFGALLHAPTVVSFSPMAAPSFRPMLAEGEAVPHAMNASWHPRRSATAIPHTHAAPEARNQLVASARPSLAHERSIDATWKPRAASHPATSVLQAKHSKPGIHAVQAAFTTDSVRGTTLIFVTQDENTLTVWRITTWQYVPSRQARADRKTT